jgi:hypothetical protein
MRVEFTQDYKGPYGTFKVGDKGDYPLRFLKRLPKDCYRVIEPEPDRGHEEQVAALNQKKKGESS